MKLPVLEYRTPKTFLIKLNAAEFRLEVRNNIDCAYHRFALYEQNQTSSNQFQTGSESV